MTTLTMSTGMVDISGGQVDGLSDDEDVGYWGEDGRSSNPPRSI